MARIKKGVSGKGIEKSQKIVFSGKGIKKSPKSAELSLLIHGLGYIPVHEGSSSATNRVAAVQLAPIEMESTEEIKSERVEIRMSRTMLTLFEKASSSLGFKNVAEYIRHVTFVDSQRVTKDQLILELSERDRISFVDNIVNPPPAGDRLKEAMTRFKNHQAGI